MGFFTFGTGFHLPSLRRSGGTNLVVTGIAIAMIVVAIARWKIGPHLTQFEPLPWSTHAFYRWPAWVYFATLGALAVLVVAKDRISKRPSLRFGINLVSLASAVLLIVMMMISILLAMMQSLERAGD